jgi:hypothetical protein
VLLACGEGFPEKSQCHDHQQDHADLRKDRKAIIDIPEQLTFDELCQQKEKQPEKNHSLKKAIPSF